MMNPRLSRVRPRTESGQRVELVPREVQTVEFGRQNRAPIDPEFRQHRFEVFPMQNVEPGEETAARPDLLHRRLIAPSPCIGEGGRIGARRIAC